MARLTPSQLKNKLRQAENKQKQAIRNYNSAVNKYNRNVRAAVNKYNQAVRTHNANVRRNRTIINNELRKMQSHRVTTHFSIQYRESAVAMNSSYNDAILVGDSLVGLSPQQDEDVNIS